MQQYSGKTILRKIAIGKIFIYEKDKNSVIKKNVRDPEAEIKRFDDAREAALAQLSRIYQIAVKETGEANASVFSAHIMMLEDPDYLDFIDHSIREQSVNAEYAVSAADEHFSAIMKQTDDEYMQSRAEDVHDISGRLLSVLQDLNTYKADEDNSSFDPGEPVILAATDLTPSETVQMDKSKILAFVTRDGSYTSHTSILARTMNIPAIIGVDISPDWHGHMAVVDGFTGTLTIDPDEEYLSSMRYMMRQEEERTALYEALKGKETATRSGRHINLYANIGSLSDVDQVLLNDGEGIGLFRSEFLYLKSNSLPSEDEQFNVYKTVAEKMGGRKVIFRTMDLGADKQIDCLNLGHEDNPAMGYRAIRICLDRPEIFRTQLRAMMRASVYGNIAIMLPMIISVDEVKQSRMILNNVMNDLTNEGIAFKPVELGIMVETPAAVWISDELAKEADFFSIGTNDLTQYILALDRQNHKLDKIYDPRHPAIMRAIQTLVTSGHDAGIPVGICGELAADPEMTRTFVDMGIDELSVAPSFILPIRDIIRSMN